MNITAHGTNTLPQIVNGNWDSYITQWSTAFKKYAVKEQGNAYIGLLPEMNGNWTGRDDYTHGLNYITALKRIQNIFTQVGVPREAIRWYFFHNVWSFAHKEFEFYYPDDAYIEALGFSADNFGWCNYPSALSRLKI